MGSSTECINVRHSLNALIATFWFLPNIPPKKGTSTFNRSQLGVKKQAVEGLTN